MNIAARAWLTNIDYAVKAWRTIVSISVRKALIGDERALWRRYLLDRLGFFPGRSLPPRGTPAIVLFINAGEVLGLNVFCAELRRLYPSHTLVLAIDNVEAYVIGERLGLGDVRVYAPFDFTWVGRRLQTRFAIDVAVFVSKIFHPVIGQAWRRSGVIVGLISGHFTPEATSLTVTLPFRRRLLALRAYERLDFVAMQSEDQRLELLKVVDRSDVVTLGNVRSDMSHAAVTAAERADFFRTLGVDPANPLVIAAATREDEALVFDAFQHVLRRWPNARVLVVPRHVESAPAVVELATAKGLGVTTLDDVDQAAQVIVAHKSVPLAQMYSLATVVVFARTFHQRGGWSNILEPAFHGRPIIFGDQLKLWPDGLVALRARHPRVCVPADAASLAESLLFFLENRAVSEAVGAEFAALTRAGEAIAVANARFVHDRAHVLGARRAEPQIA